LILSNQTKDGTMDNKQEQNKPGQQGQQSPGQKPGQQQSGGQKPGQQKQGAPDEIHPESANQGSRNTDYSGGS
jgi:hypothetical protein